ncbi:MAG TPA: hypothetical protein VGL61_12900 [Kofleriaceae bacterium]
MHLTRVMSKRNHRPQKAERITVDDTKPVVVRPLEHLDRVHNPRDIDPDTAAMRSGMEHGGTIESRAAALATRGDGGRKRSGARVRYRPGRDLSKKR